MVNSIHNKRFAPVNQIVIPNRIANSNCEAGVIVRRVSHGINIQKKE